jgi:competence protein ComEC
MEKITKQLLKFLILPLVLLVIVIWVADLQSRPDYLLHVHFLDVGQGDSIFIQTYQGNQIVIDGGPNDKVLAELGEILPWHDRSLDMLILTHPDADHVSGLIEILRRYKVKQVLLTGVMVDTAADREFEKLLAIKGVEKIYAHQGQRVWLDNATVFDIYSPLAQTPSVIKDANETSIVGKLSFGQTSILFTGDAGATTEDWLLPQFNLQSDILKVGHHGSRFSSEAKFVAEVAPQYAVIEVGKDNTYGHPTQQVLDILNARGFQVLRTDQAGTIQFISDGINLDKK